MVGYSGKDVRAHRLGKVPNPGATVDVMNASMLKRLHGKHVRIYSDGVQEFRHPDFLILKEQLTITNTGVEREPLPDRRMPYRTMR
jgi:hypothetical protein